MICGPKQMLMEMVLLIMKNLRYMHIFVQILNHILSLYMVVFGVYLKLLALQQRMWNSTCLEQIENNCNDNMEDSKDCSEKEILGFAVKNAFLFPSEVEKGTWPENYSLSDHARLSVVFSPVKMQSSS